MHASKAPESIRSPVDVSQHLDIANFFHPERPVLAMLSFIAGSPIFELRASTGDEYEQNRFLTLHSALADRSSQSPCAAFLPCRRKLSIRNCLQHSFCRVA